MGYVTSDKPMRTAREIFYKILRNQVDDKDGLKKLEELKKKSKVVKGYIFGINAILRNKKRKFVYDPVKNPEYLNNIYQIVRNMGDNRFLGDFEKGYFLAWKDYIRYIKGSKSIND
jgi:hypothetical protein